MGCLACPSAAGGLPKSTEGNGRGEGPEYESTALGAACGISLELITRSISCAMNMEWTPLPSGPLPVPWSFLPRRPDR